MAAGIRLQRALGLRPRRGEMHSQRTFLSNFILGSQDGLVNVLGIILGVSAATSDVRIIYVASLAALAAESISMGAVAYTSTVARRRQYLGEEAREKMEMRTVPKKERAEVRGILERWGYRGKELEELTDHLEKNKKAMLEFMMAHELDLQRVEKSEAARSFAVVGLSTVFGSFVPLLPFLFYGSDIRTGAIASVVISGLLLFLIGIYEAKTTVGSLWRSGVQLAIIGLVAGFAGYLIGRFIGAVPV